MSRPGRNNKNFNGQDFEMGNEAPNRAPIVHIYPTTPTFTIQPFDGSGDICEFLENFESQAFAFEWPNDKQVRLIQAY